MVNKAPHSVLLVSSSEKGIAAISELLDKSGMYQLSAAKNAGEARRLLSVRSFDIVIINTPLTDEFGAELAISLSETTCSGIMVIAKADISETVAYKTEDFGIVTVPKPINGVLFHHAVKLLTAMRDKYAVLESENKKLKLKLDEVKLVQRAKNILMENLKMTEEQAHHYIERQAMDMRITRYEVANAIIKTY